MRKHLTPHSGEIRACRVAKIIFSMPAIRKKINASDRELSTDEESKRILKSGKNCGRYSPSKLTYFRDRAQI